MKQVLQYIRTGQTVVAEVPAPRVGGGAFLIQAHASLVSAGTERMVVGFAHKNLLEKARARPDLVHQTWDKAWRDGLLTTLDAVRNRLDQPMALGYSCAGIVIDAGPGVSGIGLGDRVACAGGGYAAHAEVVAIPKNLLVSVPDNVELESAAFTTLGAVALQGIRLAQVNLGEVVAVIGLGLLGQLTVQMLRAAGCLVIGTDPQPMRTTLASQLGAQAVATAPEVFAGLCRQYSSGRGADAVLITADTEGNQPIELAGDVARDKGVVVAVGAVGMNIPRKVYYEKELDFRISRSYGPGRYDTNYEEGGHDYPYSYVRWTEQRNMQAFVQLLAEGKVDVRPLITHRFPIDDAAKAYELITSETGETFLGVLLTYPGPPDLSRKVVVHSASEPAQTTRAASMTLGVLGAGNFATATMLPVLKRLTNAELIGIASGKGASARSAAERYGFQYCSSDPAEVIADPKINTVAILTRHHLHASQVIAALAAGKNVFVEKPLCLSEIELQSILKAVDSAQTVPVPAGNDASPTQRRPLLLVGFNRRFALMARQLKAALSEVTEPLVMHYRVNAGYIPTNHWVHDPAQGGGRLIGEACHFVDFLVFLAGQLPEGTQAWALRDAGRYCGDNAVIQLEFADGSLGTITYLANGDKTFGKERVEVFGGGLVAVLDDFRRLEIVHHGRRRISTSRLRQDKGHHAEWMAFSGAILAGGPTPIPLEELVATTRVTFAAVEAIRHAS